MALAVAGMRPVVKSKSDGRGHDTALLASSLPVTDFRAGRPMLSFHVCRDLRPAAAALCALLLVGAAGTAGADEIPYLMYAPGAKGKTEPIRVLWDEVDGNTARITIDAGDQFAPWLAKLGLSRVLKHDAKRNGKQFVVRDAELTSFVKKVANSIVQGIVETSKPQGEPAPPSDADVQGAVLLITPAPGNAYGELEVVARLHVSYLAPQKSGPAQVKDLINNDLTFVGDPEPMAPDDVALLIDRAYGAYIPDAKKKSVKPAEQIKLLDDDAFAATLRRLRVSPAANAQTDTVVDRSRNPPIVYIRANAASYISAHEVMYLYQSDTFRALGRALSRGSSHILADQATADGRTGKSRFAFGDGYVRESAAVRALLDGYGRDLVLPAFFGKEPTAIKALQEAVDRRKGRGSFDRFLDLLGRGDTTPPQPRVDQAVTLIKP
jgi:hypothetical protein